MKRLITTIVAGAALAVSATTLAKEWEQVRIGTEGAYPPFNYIDSAGELQGFDVDIAKALCEEMGVECTLVAQDWDGIIPGLLAGKYDAIVASMSITPERKERVAFTDKYYQTPAKFMVKKGADLDVSPEGLPGKTVGAQKATTHATYLQDNYPDTDIRLYDTQEQANLDLVSGRVDAVLADSIVLDEWMQEAGDGCCAFTGPDITAPEWFGEGIGIAIRKEDKELVKMFNDAIAAIRENGTYKKINDKYFAFDIYGE